jgi:hypothetical protein
LVAERNADRLRARRQWRLDHERRGSGLKRLTQNPFAEAALRSRCMFVGL